LNLKGCPWSSQETQIAILNGKQSILELSKLLPGRSIDGITLKLRKLGVNRGRALKLKQFDFTEFELGALVGLLEGEGSLGLNKHKVWKKDQWCLRPYVAIANTDAEILAFVKTKIGFGSITGRSAKHPAWNYVIYGQSSISSLLAVLLPFLITSRKTKLAILVKDFCDRRLAIRRAGGWARYEQRDWDAYEETRRLNRKGPRKLKTTSIDAVTQQEGYALQSPFGLQESHRAFPYKWVNGQRT